MYLWIICKEDNTIHVNYNSVVPNMGGQLIQVDNFNCFICSETLKFTNSTELTFISKIWNQQKSDRSCANTYTRCLGMKYLSIVITYFLRFLFLTIQFFHVLNIILTGVKCYPYVSNNCLNVQYVRFIPKFSVSIKIRSSVQINALFMVLYAL